MKLPKSIISKYGISKKAWSVFKGRKGHIGGGRHMARRKHGFFSHRKASVKPELLAVTGAGWGALRPMASNLLASVVPQGSLGGFADEAIFGALGYIAAKKSKGLMRHAGLAILTIEAASVGSSLIGGIGGQATNQGQGGGWF